MTGVSIESLEEAGIVYNLPKKIIDPKIDFNKLNNWVEKDFHYSYLKAANTINELYPQFFRLYSQFVEEVNPARSNSKLNLTEVEWYDKKRYDKTELKTRQKSFNLTDKKHYSTLTPYQYNPRKYITKFNSLIKPKNLAFISAFNSFFNHYINKFETADAVISLTDKKQNTAGNTLHITTDLQNIEHNIVLEKTSLKRAMQNFAKAVVHEELDGIIFYSYKSLAEFLEKFDPSFHVSKQSLSNYKRRKLIFKPFILNNKITYFFYYVKGSYPLFETKAFLSLCYKGIPKNKKV